MDTAVLPTPGDPFDGLQPDLFHDRVFVFTPNGDVEELPAGSTPVDFAYAIGTETGHRCFAARVNNRLVHLDCHLKNGDIVEIVTTSADAGPSRDWLSVVRSAHAREEIQRWFSRRA